MKNNYFLGDFLGLSQYGLLHFGQTLGFSSIFLGIHSCPQRSHLNPLRVIFTLPIRIEYNIYKYIKFQYIIFKVKFIYS